MVGDVNSKLNAGKGFQGPLTEEFIGWLTATMAEVEMALGAEANYIRPDEVENELKLRLGRYVGWEYQEDKFGPRMVAVYTEDEDDPDAGEVHVAVIYSRGKFKLDIRNWYAN